jgi:glycosyltransferase involved in cell wall biosynthesis
MLEAPLRHRPVLLIGHFPPPVHGMAVAMDALGDLFATQGPVVRLRTVPRRLMARQLHHLSRVYRVSAALIRLVSMRRLSGAALLSVDAGYGMVYTIVLAMAARCLRYGLTFDHHSNAYISRPSKLMATLVTVAGEDAVHVFKCELVRAEFQRIYGRTTRTRVIAGTYALSDPPSIRARATIPGRPLTLGHLSNLSIEKGLEEVIRFGQEAMQLGLADKVILAGRATTARERGLLERAVAAGHVDYRGPVFSDDKERFFHDIDIFLFPSRYRNELSPLVVWESLLRGVPVIAYRAGCLTQDALGPGSVVIEPSGDYVRLALQQLKEWVESPSDLAQARADSIQRAAADRREAIADALSTGRELFAHQR